ncbi:MAG: 50S ribosomal protein L15 [Deltaproteobacteria bacterium]|nr:50S ribosomal protein L15 [Deltaproteobacteria bacterium]MBI2500796.1 50S ribosomal protein L15 [Deltaproteobacteria bacterium]MBI4196461.1 50S ribosomal protein L15 [Deltaproteobacteria bacterium]
MNLGNLIAPDGARKKKKRLGRGEGSGHGGTSTKGHKGQKSRSGGTISPGFEGGQMPLIRRLPKRGFVPWTRREFSVVNVGDLGTIPENTVVDLNYLKKNGFLKQELDGLKILGDGEIKVPLVIRAHRFSKTAQEKIKNAGGRTEVVE